MRFLTLKNFAYQLTTALRNMMRGDFWDPSTNIFAKRNIEDYFKTLDMPTVFGTQGASPAEDYHWEVSNGHSG